MLKKTDSNTQLIKNTQSAATSIYEKGSGKLTQLNVQGWNLLAEEVSFPIAVLNEKLLQGNAQWMQDFTDQSAVKLAPHGKTTMAPELFKLQLEQGCWGISLATVPQVVNAYHSGITRIILANQLIGGYHFELIANLLMQGDLTFYCFVDSIENVHSLGEYFTERNIPLKILLEVGVDGGRCGWRDVNNITPLIEVIKQYDCLHLSGLSFYEGVIYGDNAVDKVSTFVDEIINLTRKLQSDNVFHSCDVVVTGAGSAWYDVVAKQLMSASDCGLNFTAVIRPGCYLIHDTGIYQQAQDTVIERSQLACDISGELVSSLELWAYVHSIPEPGLAIIGLGKRDVAFDAGLPTPQSHFRPKLNHVSVHHENPNNRQQFAEPQPVDKSWQVVDIMDQHCMMKIPQGADLLVGDLVAFSSSHPCLTIDKWRQLAIVDEKYIVKKTIATYF